MIPHAPDPGGVAPPAREQGIALVVVLWVVVILSLQVSLFTVQAMDGMRLIENAGAVARGTAIAHAAMEIAVARLSARAEGDRWSPDGKAHELVIDGARVVVTVSDENGRVNLNDADPPLLEGLLKAVGAPIGDARALADRIADWRDRDHERRSKGAEDDDYKRARRGYGAADHPFLDTADLARVIGIGSDLAARLRPHVTIHSASGRINPDLASATVLRALPNVPQQAVEQAIARKSRGAATAADLAQLLSPAQVYLSNMRGPTYRIEVAIPAAQGRAAGSGEAVIALGLDPLHPYRTLAYRLRTHDGP